MDLKNIDLKDIKFEDIKAKVLAIADKKTLIKFGIGFGSIIIFLIIYYSILNPIVQKKKTEIDDLMNKKAEIAKFEKEIISAKAKIKKLMPEYKKHSSLFHSRKEVEGLYESLSQYAGTNSLVISKIAKKKPEPVSKASLSQKKSKKKKKVPNAKNKKKKIWTVGTSTVRTLETVVVSGFQITAKFGWTDKFVYPPYKFKMCNRLITNFHQPKSTLMMLVAAFAGKDLIMKAYKEAIKKKYKFYSYGDSMLIIE